MSSSNHTRPPSSANASSSHALSELDHICSQLSLPPSTVQLARSILSATYCDSAPDAYYAACAIYVAAASDRPQTPLPLSTLLSAAGGQLLITDFFARAKLVAADASTRLPRPAPRDPTSAVHDTHLAFMVAADVWRKLTELSDAALLQPPPHARRMAWLFFLVCKAHLTSPASPLPNFHAYHLLLACLVEAGLVRGDAPIATLCAATSAVAAQVHRSRASLRAALPPAVLARLPLHPGPDPAAVCAFLDAEYAALLRATAHSLAADERVFVDAPHLLASPITPPPTSPPKSDALTPALSSAVDGFATPTRSPSRKRRMQEPPARHTPRTRADLLREKMALTPRPSRFSRFIGAGRGADALDALAAVASSAPHSPAVSRSTSLSKTPVPATPMSTGCAAVSWLDALADRRPETVDEDKFLSCPADEVATSEAVRKIINDPKRWVEIVETVRRLSARLSERIPGLTGLERTREAMAVFFASFEHILLRETSRLKEKPHWIVTNLIKAACVHKSIFLCAWELTSAAYGRRDLAVFCAALEAFEMPPLDALKAIESFIRLPEMPRSLKSHMVLCGNRVLESMAWKRDSKLVQDLRERASEKAAESRSRSVRGDENQSRENSSTMDPVAATTDGTVPSNPVREFALEFFFKKLLAVASERAQELLIRLAMDSIAEPVWASIKFAVWEKWHLVVDRHLDQIIMCCIYGVSKVRRYELKFREIIQTYQNMSHVREPSFNSMIPGVFRNVSLDPHLDLVPTDDLGQLRLSRAPETKGARGDIIKLYNQVFIHAMKAHILQFQIQIPHIAGVQAAKKLGSSATPSTESHQTLAERGGTSGADSVYSGNGAVARNVAPSVERKDTLNEKVMSSPMRMLRPHASPRRVGRVTVSPMSPGGRSLVAIRQSPARRATGSVVGSMTPGTRKLYAFGESPVRSLDGINRAVAQDREHAPRRNTIRRPVPLSFEGNGVGQRTASMRQRVADALARQSGKGYANSLKFDSSSDAPHSSAGTADALTRSRAAAGQQ